MLQQVQFSVKSVAAYIDKMFIKLCLIGCVLLNLEPRCTTACQEVAMPLQQLEASGISNLARQDLTGRLTVSKR